MSVQFKDIKMEIKVEKQETQYEIETLEESMVWNVHSGQDSIKTKEENLENQNGRTDNFENYKEEIFDPTNATCKSEIDIKENPLVEVKAEPMSDIETPQDGSTSQLDVISDAKISKNNYKDLFDHNNFTCKSEIDIKEHPLIKVKDELMSDTEAPQDGSTNQLRVIPDAEISENNSNVIEKTENMICKYEDILTNEHACKICQKKFSKKRYLYKHMYVHSNVKPYGCEICPKTFANKALRNEHMRLHSDERPYECEICKKTFLKSGALAVHLRIHTGERPYECETCKKTFMQKGYYNTHVRIHAERTYECKLCNKKFHSKVYLSKHMQRHSDERPFECEICKKAFINRGALSIHMRNHTGERPYECEICKKTFTRAANLSDHKRRHFGRHK